MVTSDLGACEWFVWDLRRSGLIDRGQLDSIVSEFLKRNPRAEAPALAEYLVEQDTLTAFQAERILNGKTQGLVLGPYVLLDAIGSGSMGQVYKASSKNDNLFYAVKVLPRRNMWNVRLARRQVRSFGQFTHTAVVPFVDVGTAGGLHYLVWPLAEGVSLEAIIQQQGKLPANQASLYAVQIAQGLTIAHQNNLFHGLLKPSNVLIGPDNQARILDFGIGSLLVENEGESLVDTMSTANTLTSGLDCASPESIMDPTNRTPAGDQYSIGCALYYCLTGRVPFPEGSAVEKMMAHQTREPEPIRNLAPDVPEGLVNVVVRLMAKTPEQRFTGCDELVEALEPFLGNVHEIPGGLPAAPAGHGSGRVSVGATQRTLGRGSAPKLPGLPSRTPGSNPGMKPAPKPLSGVKPAPAARAGTATPPPATRPSSPAAARASVAGFAAPQTPSSSHPGVKVPTPAPVRGGPSLPSRASFQLPPMAEETDSSAVAASSAPAESAGRPARQSAGWTEEEPAERRGGAGFGPIGLIAAAILLMVAAYFGATQFMK